MILNKLHQEIQRNRRPFDPKSNEDLIEFKYFLANKKWKNLCPFFLEWPYLTIPDMLKDKMVMHMLDAADYEGDKEIQSENSLPYYPEE